MKGWLWEGMCHRGKGRDVMVKKGEGKYVMRGKGEGKGCDGKDREGM